MISFTSITFFNIFNLILGIILGFLIMLAIFSVFISRFLAKQNKNNDIRNISKKTFYTYLNSNSKIKEKIFKSLLFETKEVVNLIHPDNENAIYELSINDVIKTLRLLEKKIRTIIEHPLCNDIKHVSIAKLIYLEQTIAKPVIILYKNKFVKVFYKAIMIGKNILNIFNPIFYMRLILNKILIKKGRKEILLITLDFVGNTVFEIYNNENNLQK